MCSTVAGPRLNCSPPRRPRSPLPSVPPVSQKAAWPCVRNCEQRPASPLESPLGFANSGPDCESHNCCDKAALQALVNCQLRLASKLRDGMQDPTCKCTFEPSKGVRKHLRKGLRAAHKVPWEPSCDRSHVAHARSPSNDDRSKAPVRTHERAIEVKDKFLKVASPN